MSCPISITRKNKRKKNGFRKLNCKRLNCNVNVANEAAQIRIMVTKLIINY